MLIQHTHGDRSFPIHSSLDASRSCHFENTDLFQTACSVQYYTYIHMYILYIYVCVLDRSIPDSRPWKDMCAASVGRVSSYVYFYVCDFVCVCMYACSHTHAQKHPKHKLLQTNYCDLLLNLVSAGDPVHSYCWWCLS